MEIAGFDVVHAVVDVDAQAQVSTQQDLEEVDIAFAVRVDEHGGGEHRPRAPTQYPARTLGHAHRPRAHPLARRERYRPLPTPAASTPRRARPRQPVTESRPR